MRDTIGWESRHLLIDACIIIFTKISHLCILGIDVRASTKTQTGLCPVCLFVEHAFFNNNRNNNCTASLIFPHYDLLRVIYFSGVMKSWLMFKNEPRVSRYSLACFVPGDQLFWRCHQRDQWADGSSGYSDLSEHGGGLCNIFLLYFSRSSFTSFPVFLNLLHERLVGCVFDHWNARVLCRIN